MAKKSILVPLIAVLVLIAGTIVIRKAFINTRTILGDVSNFEECKKAGYDVYHSYPGTAEKCKTPDGKVFDKKTSTGKKDADTDTDTSPVNPGQSTAIKASFGMWVTLGKDGKAVFPDGLAIQVKDIHDSTCKPAVYCVWQGEITVSIATPEIVTLGMVTNKSDSMNGYTYTLVSATPTSVVIVVQKTGLGGGSASGCYVSGCSGQICSDSKDVASTCEYSPKYACFKEAKCEKQQNGSCGWTQTPQLQACLTK